MLKGANGSVGAGIEHARHRTPKTRVSETTLNIGNVVAGGSKTDQFHCVTPRMRLRVVRAAIT